MPLQKSQLAQISESFAHSAVNDFHGSSPLYEALATNISTDPELLDLASHALSKPVPMIFFAAIHYLLLDNAAHPLATFYPDINSVPCATDTDLYSVFQDFCFKHRDEIKDIISTYHVQTNEVRRCACLLPAFSLAVQEANGLPLTLVEIGASAGLNLLWDQYGYDYGNGLSYGNRASPVQLTCALRGNEQPLFSEVFPRIALRIGIDLNPTDVRDELAVNWLHAFIWPEHTGRFDLLHRAVKTARNNPPEVRKGDVLELLPDIMNTVQPQTFLCLFHTFVSNQMSPEARNVLAKLIADYGSRRHICCISIDLSDKYKYPRLELLSYIDGVESHRHLANCSGHSRWMEWLEPLEESNDKQSRR
jgi:hypothetical protein